MIPLTGLADFDNNVCNSGELAHHYFTLFLVLLRFLVTLLSERVDFRGNMRMTCIPHGKRLKQQTGDGGDVRDLGCQSTPILEGGQRRFDRIHRNINGRADLPR